MSNIKYNELICHNCSARIPLENIKLCHGMIFVYMCDDCQEEHCFSADEMNSTLPGTIETLVKAGYLK